MTPGPRPSKSCPDEIKIHLRFGDKRKQILNDMGSGSAFSKIMYLIDQEGDKQLPKTKTQLLADWERDRREVMRLAAVTNEERNKLIELGCTPEQLMEIEEESEDAEN